MKKLLSLLAAATMIFASTTPAQAESTYFDSWSGWNAQLTQSASLSYTGSLKAGGTYKVTSGGTTPGGKSCILTIVKLGSGEYLATQPVMGNFDFTSPSRSADSAGTIAEFGGLLSCLETNGSISENNMRYLRLTFESPLEAPANFTIFPQGAGTAFATWGVANGATSYTVSAAPGGATCTTTQNFCNITGLTAGDTYTFTLTATDGSATSSVGSGPVLLRQPVTVGVGLQGGTWRSGETVTAQYSMQGSNASPTISWYRCTSVVGAMPTPPPPGECSVVGSGASYVLSSGDVGKYITAHVFVNNTDPQGQMTASSNQAVLASGAVAPAPVADPAGKPTIVNVVNPIVSVAGGTQVTITGTGLSGVTAVTVGGLPAIVVSKTDTTVVVQVPVSTKTGLADLSISNDKGSVISKSAIVYTTNPVLKVTKTKTITGFTASSKALTAAQKSAVKTLITVNPTLTELTCAAKTTGVKASKTELAKATTLAKATCAYAKTVKKTLVTKTSAAQTLPKAKASRTVLLTLKN
jgi:hypothetical protein